MSVASYSIVAVAIILASCMQASIGFGMGMLAAPIVAIVDPGLIPGTLIMLAALLTIFVVIQEHQQIDLAGTGWALAGRVPGTIAGALLLAALPEQALALTLAGVVLAGVALTSTGWIPAPHRRNLVLAGATSGVLGTATAIGGPPMALVWQNTTGARLRGTMSGFFLVGSLMSIAVLTITGAVDGRTVSSFAVLMPAVAIGYGLSRLVNHLLDRQRQRWVAIVISALGAIVLMVRQLVGFLSVPKPPDEPQRPSDVTERKVKSAVRTVELLEYLASRQERPARIREICAALDMPRSSAHALLRTLMAQGWIRADTSGTLYSIGIRALLVGTSYLDTDPYLPAIAPFLDDLRQDLDETFHLARLDGTDVVYLATRESRQYVRTANRVGRRLPAYTTALGKALLAERFGAERDEHLPATLVPLTAHTITDRGELDEVLDEVRIRGYAADNEENTVGLRCFAVALHYARPAQDAISASVPIARLTDEREREIVEALRAVGDKASRVVRSMLLKHQSMPS